jgi:hypothetical protein
LTAGAGAKITGVCTALPQETISKYKKNEKNNLVQKTEECSNTSTLHNQTLLLCSKSMKHQNVRKCRKLTLIEAPSEGPPDSSYRFFSDAPQHYWTEHLNYLVKKT